MNEAETRAEHIDPALKAAGWGVIEGSRIRREYPITLGRLHGAGKRGKSLTADYVLEYRNIKLAVVEAKAWDKPLTEGVGQAKDYAGKLALRFAYATNGQGIYGVDMHTGVEAELAQFPTPDQLWNRTFAAKNAWRDRFAAVPFEDKGGYFQGRYYQDIAVERVLDAIAKQQSRILLTLATGTGKTFIAFQIAWKLFHSRWNLNDWKTGGEPTRRPRILFLADRNILANQAYNAFSAFPEDALVRIEPDEIRKKGKVPKNGSLFFTIFQTFMSGRPPAKAVRPEPVEGDNDHALQPFDKFSDRPPAKAVRPEPVEGDNDHALRPFDKLSARPPAKAVRPEPVEGDNDHALQPFDKFSDRPPAKAVRPEPVEGDNDHALQPFDKFSDRPPAKAVRPEPVEGDNDHGLQPFDKLSAQPERSFYFGEYPPDFFDFIVIDECHRGGANDESQWRDILDYFAPAVQLGLTATPKRKDNVDTYAYFGEPVLIYSLKAGINDGFLTPFRVKRIATTLDDYVYTPDDTLIEGEIEAGKRYEEADFNRIIEIKEREQKRVEILLSQIDQREKTLVFCATQDHALAVRDLINQIKSSADPNYCQRVTANDVKLGEQHLREFQDNEKTMPTVLTTSQKLSTGVDARNIRNIALLRPIHSMIEFKQIIGRGTRLYDGKDYFTLYDFVGAHQHFSDPEWDGEPLEPELKDSRPRCPASPESPSVREPAADYDQRQMVKVKLADGKARTIQHMMITTFWHPDGTPMSAQQFVESLFGQLPDFFKDEAELRALWSDPETRRKLLTGLAEKGFGNDQLAEMQKSINAEKSDLFDVLAHVAYALEPLTREQRAGRAMAVISTLFNSKQQVFLNFVLSHYIGVGVEELDPAKLTPLLRLKYHNSIADAVADLGKPEEIGKVFAGFQKYLYQQQAVA